MADVESLLSYPSSVRTATFGSPQTNSDTADDTGNLATRKGMVRGPMAAPAVAESGQSDQGELSDIKQASLPIIAAVGGMLVPALVYIYIKILKFPTTKKYIT